MLNDTHFSEFFTISLSLCFGCELIQAMIWFFCALAVATKSGLPWSPHDTQINAWKRSLCKSWKLWQKPKSGPAIVLVLECQMMSRITGCRDLTAKTLDFCMSYLPHVHLLAWQLGILNEQPQLSAGWFVFQSVSKANFSSLLSALWGSQLAGGKWSGGTSKVINLSSVFQKPVNTRHVINFWGVWPCQLEDTFFFGQVETWKAESFARFVSQRHGLELAFAWLFFSKLFMLQMDWGHDGHDPTWSNSVKPS